MAFDSHHTACPACHDASTALERTTRTKTVRFLLWGSKRYKCHRCGRQFIKYLGHLFQW